MTAQPRVRVYVPSVWADLRAGAPLATRGVGYAVTSDVRDADPAGDLDDWEFAAFSDAMDASLALLDETTPARRVVVSVDLDGDSVAAADGARVVVPDTCPAAAVAAVHVDGVEAEAAVRSVVRGGPADVLDDVALEWFAPSEIASLLTQGS